MENQNFNQPIQNQPLPQNPQTSSIMPKAKPKKNLWIAFGILGAILIIAIISFLYFNKGEQPKPIDITDINNIVEANNQFALDYYSQLKEKDDGNIFFSPFSISSALAITYEGARGETAEEIQTVFYFPADDNLRRTEYATVFDELNKEDKKYKLSTANALWAQEDYQFLTEYLDTVEKYYGGKATNLDFVKDPEGSRVTINNWVEDQTNDKIRDLIPQGVIDELTRLILTNAIYFKGEWVKQFNEEETKEEDFRISKNDYVEVQMMQRTDEEAKFNYAENDKLQILEMPYSGEELSMLILLPKNDDLTVIEDLLSTQKLSEWEKDLENQRVDVYIPKFKFETKYFMANDLKTMGMPTAFQWPGADFSGMDGTKDLYIGEVIHQAFVEVNEEGTEAAAATAVIMVGSVSMEQETPEIPVFRADHPFIFLIQEKASGNILFMGRVVNPTL
jgi:serpin B